MPRAAAFATSAIADLYQQLRYAPPETRRRQMDNAEALIGDVEREGVYPPEFVVFRITGYRPAEVSGEVIVGAALIADLVNFIQRVSYRLDLPMVETPEGQQGDRPRMARPLEEVAAGLSVSMKTLRRYRKAGLVCHYVVDTSGAKRLGVYDDALRRFMDAQGSRVEQARSYTRLDDAAKQAVVAQARQMKQDNPALPRLRAAERIAAEIGRAVGTVNAILQEHDAAADAPIFGGRGPLTERETAIIARAARWGVSRRAMAKRFDRTPSTIQRAIVRGHAMALRGLTLPYTHLPTFDLDDAREIILHPAVVRSGLDEVVEDAHALPLVAQIRAFDGLDDGDIDALTAAYNLLKKDAALAKAQWPKAPGRLVIDPVETDLRWALRLKHRLVSAGLPAALRAIEQHLHRDITERPAQHVADLLALAAEVVARTIDGFDPSQRQQLPRVCGQAMDRALAALDLVSDDAGGTRRAAARHEAGRIDVAAALRNITPWRRLVDLPLRQRRVVGALDEPPRALIEMRYGLAGEPPQTLKMMAEAAGLPISSLSRRLNRAERGLRDLSYGAVE